MSAGCALRGLEQACIEVRAEETLGASWVLYRIVRGLLEDAEEGEDLCGCSGKIKEAIASCVSTMVPPLWIPRVLERACLARLDPSSVLRELIDYQSRAFDRIQGNSMLVLHNARRVVTISYSGTVERVLHHVRPDTLIVVPESRPGSEGVELARRLSLNGKSVVLVPDFGVAGWLEPGGTVVIIGADAVTGDGCVYNKIGSRLIAMAAKTVGVPVYSVFDATKTVPEKMCGELRILERAYQVEGWGAVSVPIFEPVSAELLSGYITELGVLVPGGKAVYRLSSNLIGSLLGDD